MFRKNRKIDQEDNPHRRNGSNPDNVFNDTKPYPRTAADAVAADKADMSSAFGQEQGSQPPQQLSPEAVAVEGLIRSVQGGEE